MTAPQPVLTAAEMRAAEDQLVHRGVSVDKLMLRAGRGAAEWVWRIAAGRSVTVLCGPGNNGGDGYVIAEALRQRSIDVTVVAPLPPRTDAARGARSLYGGIIASDARGAVLVDCLFGTGLKRPLPDELSALLLKLRGTHDYAVAIDLPSGVDADTGLLLDERLERYDLTVALGAWKRAHWLMPGLSLMGERRLVPLGIEPPGSSALLSPRPILSAPDASSHKYSRGLVGIIGGTMTGAAVLASEAAMRAGAGYVKLLSEHSHPAAPAGLVIEPGDLPDTLRDERIRALLVGPGLGRDEEARTRLWATLGADRPLVLDADALMVLGKNDLARRSAPVILTPHGGELAALCRTFRITDENKVAQAKALALASGAVVLAKGADNVLTDGNSLRFFPSPSSWLSTAGSGDVLAGIVVSRLALTGNPVRACEEAVWLHAEAARNCGPAFTAGELANKISAAYRSLV